MQDSAELISIALTIPTIVLSLYVVWLWAPEAFRIVTGKRFLQYAATDWFIAGVALGFLGAVLDNSYWQIAWCANFLEASNADRLMEAGVFFNIVSRQIFGIAAAYCHVRSYKASQPGTMKTLSFVFAVSLVFGYLFAVSLWLVRMA